MQDVVGPVDRLLRDLRSSRTGLSAAEAERRLAVYGPNVLSRQEGSTWLTELVRQLTHPLALLLWGAAVLAVFAGTPVLSGVIVGVVLLNAVLAFVQEQQAERAVEALRAYLPERARVVRQGRLSEVPAVELVPGDVVEVGEGDRVSADCRVLDGEVEVDLSALNGESVPVSRTAADSGGSTLLEARDVLFSGTTCTSGRARGVVIATGQHTELGRIAALSQKVHAGASPLELQVRRVARLIAVVAVGAGLVFLPIGMLAGLSLRNSAVFAVGLLVANVPEGLLPTITLALAIGVRSLARTGAVVKRLSAVETLGATSVICTDKTGTLTENRMGLVALWAGGAEVSVESKDGASAVARALRTGVRCSSVERDAAGALLGDPTEVALVEGAERAGVPVDLETPHLRVHAFNARLKRMSVIDRYDDQTGRGGLVHVKGAPEEVVALCTRMADVGGCERLFGPRENQEAAAAVAAYADAGLRVIALAERRIPQETFGDGWDDRGQVERDLTLLGLAALLDPPRREVPDAVARCHAAGVRVHMITGDHAATAREVARRVGIGVGDTSPRVLTETDLARMDDESLARVLAVGEVVFARTTPETKLRIADLVHRSGDVVAVTGDGVNDAPALQRADIGVAMGRNGTDVAREAATMVLTDDNFATIVKAIHEGRRVYENVRKFILYIFAHAVPEVVPFLVFALSGGAVPLPLTVMQILAIDLGTETLPALALGREPAEPDLMHRPPVRRQSVVDRQLMLRAWGLMGAVSALLVLAAFFLSLHLAGWSPGAETGRGYPLHQAYLQSTTAVFLGIVACQLGTAFAARTSRVSLREIGLLTNRLLLAGIAFELAFSAALVGLPGLSGVFGMAVPDIRVLLLIALFPLVAWGVDEAYRWRLRARERRLEGISP